MCGFKLPGSRDCASVFDAFWENTKSKNTEPECVYSWTGRDGENKGLRGRKGSKTGQVPKSRLSSRMPPLEARGIWQLLHVTCLCPGPAWAWSHIYHFHLIKNCCCAHPTLWLGGQDNTQLMIATSGCMVAWWPIVKYLVSIKAHWQAKSWFSKGE